MSRAGARMQKVDRVSSSPSPTSHTNDERRSASFDGGISMPLKVAKGASKAFAVAGAVLVAALLLEGIAMGESETDRARPPTMVVNPLARVGRSGLSFSGLWCRWGLLGRTTSLPC